MAIPESTPTIRRGLAIATVRGVLFFTGTAIVARQILGDDVDPFGGSGPALMVIAVLLACDVVGTSMALWRIGGQTPTTLRWPSTHLGRDVVIGVTGFAVCAGWLALVMLAVGGTAAIREVVDAIAAYSPSQRVCFIAIGVCGGAIAEESLYRGYLQPALVGKLGVVGGIVLTSLLFSLLHFNFNPISVVSKFLLGCTYGVIAWRTGSLTAPAVTHALVWVVIGAA